MLEWPPELCHCPNGLLKLEGLLYPGVSICPAVHQWYEWLKGRGLHFDHTHVVVILRPMFMFITQRVYPGNQFNELSTVFRSHSIGSIGQHSCLTIALGCKVTILFTVICQRRTRFNCSLNAAVEKTLVNGGSRWVSQTCRYQKMITAVVAVEGLMGKSIGSEITTMPPRKHLWG